MCAHLGHEPLLYGAEPTTWRRTRGEVCAQLDQISEKVGWSLLMWVGFAGLCNRIIAISLGRRQWYRTMMVKEGGGTAMVKEHPR